jgi:VIT1/CCC1 family predicted Fe2+/Mn2+ transporter
MNAAGNPKDRSRPLLSPAERASEIVFGVIMTMSVTAAMELGGAQSEGTRALLAAALGCNIAWGMVDAVMYLMNTLVERVRVRKTAQDLSIARTEEEFRVLLGETTPDGLVERLDSEAIQRFRRWVSEHAHELPAGLERSDLLAALQIWLLVFLSTLPLVLPFVFLDSVETSMRVSQAIAVVILFGLGMRLGKWLGVRPGASGLAFAAVGVVITMACIAMGG